MRKRMIGSLLWNCVPIRNCVPIKISPVTIVFLLLPLTAMMLMVSMVSVSHTIGNALPADYINPKSCTYHNTPPAPVDTSELPVASNAIPQSLPVPNPPVGGKLLGACSEIVPPGVAPYPRGISSASWLLADYDTGDVLAAKDPHGRYRPASTIKLLLAYVVAKMLPLDTIIHGAYEDEHVEGNGAGVYHDGVYTVRQLLAGLLLASGNDAAQALSRALGGKSSTLRLMNAYAQQLQAYDTRVASPSGLDAPGMSCSAYDLALILRAVLSITSLREILQATSAYFPGHGKFPGYLIYSENKYVHDPGNIGGKTGYTDDAKKTYVGAIKRNGRRLIVVQLYGLSYENHSYWDQSDALLEWGSQMDPRKSIGILVSAQQKLHLDMHPEVTQLSTDSAYPMSVFIGFIALIIVSMVCGWRKAHRGFATVATQDYSY